MSREPSFRTDLPEGTVTLLFTDIERSTQLVRRLGGGYSDVQDRHRVLLRAAFARHGGVEVDTQGDAFMVAFRGATDAAHAAADAQRALAAEEWPEDVQVRVRMGLHTGEPSRGPEGYVGIDVVRAARICAVAHGGQVLLSQVSRDLLAEAGAETIDLGRHRLKDIGDSEQLYQLAADGIERDFPPPRTLSGVTLPALHHRLVGRERDLAEVKRLLELPEIRLVTITGPGGAGKSRLALEVAGSAALERPVRLVGLAPVAEPELVLPEVARVVGARDSADQSLVEAVADALRGTDTLLYLDNLEHLTGAARDIAKLLDLASDLDILATSRRPLQLAGERVLPLAPLPIEDAATLFVELAAARGIVLQDDALPSVLAICRRLDGLPLAIELVAARLVVLTPGRILEALDEGLALEMEGPVDLPDRQRTLGAAIAWSYGLLTPGQRELHDALAIFAGGCTLDDARAVAEAGPGFYGDLESLVAWSLVRSDVLDGDVRLSMLETVREDAVARLARDGTLDELRRRHAERFVDVALRAESVAGHLQRQWLDRVERELDNIRTALEWCLASGRVEDALRTVCALDRFWPAHGHITEARRWLARGLEHAEEIPPDLLAAALWCAARQAAAQDDLSAEIPLLERALTIYQELEQSRESAMVMGELGWVFLQQGDLRRAEDLCDEALTVARGTGDAATISAQLNYLADVYSARGDRLQALAAHEEALELRRTLGDPMRVANSTYNLGIAAWENGEVERARAAFEETHALAEALGDVIHSSAAVFMLAELDLEGGKLDRAEERIRACLATYTELENDRSRAECLVVLGGVAAERGSLEDAARLFGAAERLRAGAPPNRFEIPVLERWERSLIDALGERLATLKAEGHRLEQEDLIATVVTSGVRH